MMFALTVSVLGIIAFALDAAFGKELFRKIYRATHAKDATPPADPPSFIAGRSVAGRIPAALVLTAIFAFALNVATVHSLLGLMAKSVVMFVMLMLGFTLAAYAHRWWNPAEKAKKVIDTLEGLESGVIDPAKKAGEIMHSAGERVKKMAADVMGERSTVVSSPADVPVAEAPVQPAQPVEPAREESFDQKLERFRKGG
ncbi:MAG: hypothetical protein A3D65_04975 [Candidatus Lloydbacteria bacterium RIFCSPHIGHO2_02_FULL_50_13]|uniref:Uncharacterized protein n=1 Tax=Candidatus Lloydbacteria bacterium RIFCSPHIGHO2_02_FULL_50_13 TaxID=1798661 RepID=A0A1G2D739_9BACT|nr:MAG: hypothetical protein A3D65_04975 [Candidatus Lloydbacteria bacterium RIFCSPHIGHO2_02_FULL_50_13]